NLRQRFMHLTNHGLDLLARLLTYDPKQRITAEEALNHPYFQENPPPKDPSMFPTWPSKSSGEKVRLVHSPILPQADHAEVQNYHARFLFNQEIKSLDIVHSFMLDFLYDTILVNNPGIRNVLQPMLDCDKVQEPYSEFRYSIKNAITNGDASDIGRESEVINEDHMSTEKACDKIPNVRSEI
ncbi:hypothetical protein IWQ61_010634, partial [Dispira simplex]